MPAGTYMLAVTPTIWFASANSNPVLKKINMRIGSASKLTADFLTKDQATRLRSDGYARVAPNSEGKGIAKVLSKILDAETLRAAFKQIDAATDNDGMLSLD